MALTYSQDLPLGSVAPDFSLLGVDGETYNLSSFASARALLVIFICNHCPYVIAIQDRLKLLAETYAEAGLRVIAINSNDAERYPADSLAAMRIRAKELSYSFPYCIDATQETARAFRAACTPDPYLFSREGNEFRLRYHGRVDDQWKDETAVQHRDLAVAVEAVLTGRVPNAVQTPSMGCSIKWVP